MHVMRSVFCQILTIAVLSYGLVGCDEFGWNPLAPGPDDPLAAVDLPPPTEMTFTLPTLEKASIQNDRSYDEDTDILVRKRDWNAASADTVEAGLLVRRRLSGGPVPIPNDPRDAVAYWHRLTLRHLRFYDLYESRNSIGPVLWRRFTMGPKICVMFVQGWTPDSAAARAVAGYYCAAPGTALTEGQAESVVRSVRLRESD